MAGRLFITSNKMGMLDHLIDKNVEPKDGMEYIYLHDMIWEEGKLEHVDVGYGAIVINVTRRPNNSLEFTLKTEPDGKRYHSNYGWAFAENTPENVKRITTYIQAREILAAMRFHVDKLRGEVADLSPKK